MCLAVLVSDHRSEMNRIVIVDDHPAFRAWARAVLAADGFRIAGEAADAASAVAEVQAVRPDVVLLDVQLPDGDGFEVADALLAAWRRPHSRIGLLMMAVGLAWFVPQVGWAPNTLLWSVSFLLKDLWAPVLGHVFVSFPSGRLRARRDRLVVALAYGWWLATRLADMLTWHPVFRPPPSTTWVRNVFGVLGRQHLNDEIGRVTAVASVLVVVLGAGPVISPLPPPPPPRP